MAQEEEDAQAVTSARFSRALTYAAAAHRRQVRKGTGVPYVSHPLAVSSLVLEHGGCEEEAIAALLHDVIEDCGKTPVEITEQFGREVSAIVEACSDAQTSPKPPWFDRKRRYLAHLREETRMGVLRVSCADKLHNASSILRDYREKREAVWSRFNASGDCQLWYYQALVQAFRQQWQGKTALLDALEEVVRELGRVSGRGEITEVECRRQWEAQQAARRAAH